jgi:biotin carboxyl carrier protein
VYKAIVNGKSFEVISDNAGITVNGKLIDWDMAPLEGGHFHIIHQHKSYRAEIISKDYITKTLVLKLNNKRYTVSMKDKFDLLLEKMGMNSNTLGKANTLRAPMPGLIVDLKVKEGESVNPGDPLIILEAMKMENVIKSAGEGVVKSVKVKKGDSVEKGQVLIEF